MRYMRPFSSAFAPILPPDPPAAATASAATSLPPSDFLISPLPPLPTTRHLSLPPPDCSNHRLHLPSLLLVLPWFKGGKPRGAKGLNKTAHGFCTRLNQHFFFPPALLPSTRYFAFGFFIFFLPSNSTFTTFEPSSQIHTRPHLPSSPFLPRAAVSHKAILAFLACVLYFFSLIRRSAFLQLWESTVS